MAKRQRRRTKGQGDGAPGRLRIVAGNWRGRRLPVIAADGLRPTSERVRETLFNWLMLWIPGKRCLDLFAGTGALGLEALSRGARHCVFVERNPRVAAALEANLATLGATGAQLIVADGLTVVDTLPAGSIDIVFLDPPFADAAFADLCRRIADSGILAPDARVYVEAPRGSADIELPRGWDWLRTGTAGNVRYGLAAARESKTGEGE